MPHKQSICSLNATACKNFYTKLFDFSLDYASDWFVHFISKDKPTTDRLENCGPFGTMCTHGVRLSDANQVDSELKEWLNEAYQMANG